MTNSIGFVAPHDTFRYNQYQAGKLDEDEIYERERRREYSPSEKEREPKRYVAIYRDCGNRLEYVRTDYVY